MKRIQDRTDENMFGRDEELERIRAAFVVMDCDMNAFRSWQKQYEKLNKRWQAVQQRYNSAMFAAKRVEKTVRQMEQMITDAESMDRKEFAQLLKELRHLQSSFDHEFIISREDQEFHSTYDTVLKLGAKALDDPNQKLILQSEVENLADLLEENLEKELPDPRKLCFFYLFNGTDQELAGLSPSERAVRIDQVYEAGFETPILLLLTDAIARADARAEKLRAGGDRKSRKALDTIQVLLEGGGEPRERARYLFELLMS